MDTQNAQAFIATKRWAFLVGEGTLTAGEVLEWAREFNPVDVPMPNEVSLTDRLMVSIVKESM